jgi:hypothetical protein
MSTNGVLSVKYATLSVTLVLVGLWNRDLRENYLRAHLTYKMLKGSSVTHETDHKLRGQGIILPHFLIIFLQKKIREWKYKDRFEDNIKIGLNK